uniref:Uncharacterized protein n=1 Tax=Arundo donax TaxID=35708 RepID=A0A0A9EH45_ARUDO
MTSQLHLSIYLASKMHISTKYAYLYTKYVYPKFKLLTTAAPTTLTACIRCIYNQGPWESYAR